MSTATDLVTAMLQAWHAGEPEQVIAIAGQAMPSLQQDEGALSLLGVAQQATGRLQQAAATFGQLAQLQPLVSSHWNNLAVVCREAGDLGAAERALLTALSLAPNDAEVHYNLGLLRTQQRQWLPARQSLLDAVQLAPHFIEARLQAAYACHVCGDNTQQEALLIDAGHWPPQPAEQALVLSAMLSVQGDLESALRTLAQASLPAEPAAAIMRLRIAAQRVLLHERNNQVEAAQAALRHLPPATLDALPAQAEQARAEGWRAHAVMAMRDGAYAEAAAQYQRALSGNHNEEGHASAAFGLGAALDRQGRYPEAWEALRHAHATQLEIARHVVPELLAADSRPLQVTGGYLGRDVHAPWNSLTSPGSRQSPVFIVGFPRSGTTLLEQMLDAHPEFQSMDERAYVHDLIESMELVGQRYPGDLSKLTQQDVDQLRGAYQRLVQQVVRALGDRCLVDKNPLNMLCLPMIMRLFPNARIILCLRHPCDVLLSCSMQPFRSPAFMVLCSSLQRLAEGYVNAFEQWHHDVEVFAPNILEWRYESVVEEFDKQAARLGEFLEISDSSALKRFAEHARNKRFISTPSYAQVTEGVHRKAVGRWQHYREQFEPILPVLQPWLDRFGYSA
ncbi:sulfotransferase [Rhodanobacter sp. AS-Z3]|uniref:tetratricopeptide repeat-containing sulfotransferase family protein n=1 Tax=Rhodanobacter sp. AS-Z3 TaxID=3031330 RepID=UPI00247B0D1D|nr:tetratricopeptide repeat-containing sulfotransferase family protein [Rhodanobacter sp. AS-Z3]WEN15119.1 sulfotransferase [Rhodanobacter sp. AS-Z3]